jgi:hypothetical protein
MLRVWVGVRLLLPAALLCLAPGWVGSWAGAALTELPYPHGVVKQVLESSQGLLLRGPSLGWIMLSTAAIALCLVMLRGRRWWMVLLGGAGLMGLAPHFSTWTVLIWALLVGLLSWRPDPVPRWVRAWACVPGSALLSPGLVAQAMGLHRWAHAAVVLVGGLVAGAAWQWADCMLSYPEVRAQMEAWPEDRLDPRIRVLAQSAPGVRAEWHGVQIVGSDAIVMGETLTQLYALPLDERPSRILKLGARWGPDRAAPLNAVTDPDTGRTWYIDGGAMLHEAVLGPAGWSRLRQVPLPRRMRYAYLKRTAADALIIASVQTAGDSPRTVLTGSLPELEDLRAVELGAADGPIPMPREVAWVDSIGKLVLSPDFGRRLWLADLETGLSEPWIQTPTLDGKMRYAPGMDRLVLALPNRPELWLIDPHSGAITQRIPTQLGNRALAIDERRGLVVVASVLTGQILVHEIETGATLDRLGTVMPMVRELALSEERGEAVLTTWVATYAFPYTDRSSP